MPKGSGRPFNRSIKKFSKTMQRGTFETASGETRKFSRGLPRKPITKGSVMSGIGGLRRSGGKMGIEVGRGFKSGAELQDAMRKNPATRKKSRKR